MCPPKPKALEHVGGAVIILADRCLGCSLYARVCPIGAVDIEIEQKVVQTCDLCYYTEKRRGRMSTACILAGGQSTRMGTAKATLLLDGKTVLEHLVQTFQPYFEDMCLVTRLDLSYSTVLIPKTYDRYAGVGPTAGIHAGLLFAKSDPVLMIAVDMPFASPQIGLKLVSLLEAYEAVVPVIDGKRHPLFSVYRKSLATRYEAAILSGKRRVESIYEESRVRYVTAEELGLREEESAFFFFNMNTPEDYAWAQKKYESYKRLQLKRGGRIE
ncbi:MAG: Molybdopterin-guanine dinucleotide biosynthesis protein MobA [Candidatus Carbobacillus altaicus]|uniref:Probable molybdenum cofactor guanylyltransferase n=1 Tax=Candidatus Carbonibacillus altaicus TaxID=2163959 RepID=A0A2R6XYA6_9BACL|nr:MAG: Molybdopterin-guanine dinucleotide biosynthesis protein MobA [Candidatus Carbobacillus altaicus]